jgi:hypothetical protein
MFLYYKPVPAPLMAKISATVGWSSVKAIEAADVFETSEMDARAL